MNEYYFIDEGITVSKSRYNPLIPEHVTMIIENGVEIIFMADYTINVYDDLFNANGVSSENGLFDSDSFTWQKLT